MALCVSIIGKDNAPYYVATTDAERELDLLFRVHAALDVVEEKITFTQGKTPAETRDLYLGMLYSTDLYKIFGYITNTKVKFILVIDSSNIALRENDVRTIFRNIHNLYADAVCNPFYTPGDPLRSKTFDQQVRNVIAVEKAAAGAV